MLSQIKNNIKADALVVRKSTFVKGAAWVCAIIIAFVLYTSSKIMNEMSSAGYYASQLLITLAQFNVFAGIIIGAILGAKDFDWQTYSVRLTNTQRIVLYASRIATLLLCAIALMILHLLIGFLFDMLAGTAEIISVVFIYKILCVTLIVFLWSCASYALAFSTKSYTIASSMGIGYLLAESFFGRFFPEELLHILPVWNQKSLLKYFFPANEGAVAIIQQTFGNYKTSLMVILGYLILLLCFLLILTKRKQY